MPKVSEAHLEARKEQIVSAAFRCFAQKGFHPTTMQDICSAAELSAGALYRYFKSKEEIIQNACGGAEAYDGAAMVEHALDEQGTADALEGLAHAFFARFEDPDAGVYNRATLQLWAEAAVNEQMSGVFHDRTNPLAVAFSRFVAEAQQRGDFSKNLDPEAVVAAIFALYDGFRVQKTFREEANTEQYRDVVVALLTGRFWTGDTTNRGTQDETRAASKGRER